MTAAVKLSNRCMVPDRSGANVCQCRAPHDDLPHASVNEDGDLVQWPDRNHDAELVAIRKGLTWSPAS